MSVDKTLVLQSERGKLGLRRNIFAFSINVLFLKKIDLFKEKRKIG